MNNLILFFLMALLANLAWVTPRSMFGLLKTPNSKVIYGFLKALEWLTCFVVFLIVSAWLEKNQMGINHQQEWEFYAVTFLMFCIMSAPVLMTRFVSRVKS